MMNWKHDLLGDVLEQIKTGSTPSTLRTDYFGGSIPWFTPGDIGIKRDLVKSSRCLTEIAIREGKANLFDEKMLLLTSIGNIGRVGILRRPASANQQITALRFRKEIDVYFAYYWFIANQQKIEQRANQAVVPILNTTQLKEIDFFYPSISQQKRIAAILEKADRLHRLRRYALELSNTYLQSVFLEMFGDPLTNPRGWKRESLGNKISFITSGSRGWAQYYSQKGAMFLRIQNVGTSQLLLDDVVYVQVPDTAEGKRTRVRSGDLLFSITADLGRTAVIPENFPEAYINQHLALLRLSDINPIFIAGLMNTPGGKAQIAQLDREGVKSGLNFDDIRGLQIFIPPPSLQQKFTQIAKKYERLRIQQREAERQAEHLFQTLLHQAFQGELTSDVTEVAMEAIHYQADDDVVTKAYQVALPME